MCEHFDKHFSVENLSSNRVVLSNGGPDRCLFSQHHIPGQERSFGLTVSPVRRPTSLVLLPIFHRDRVVVFALHEPCA